MDQKSWDRVSEILDTALDLEGEEQQQQFIEEECGDDQELKAKVIELLDSIKESNTTGFLEGTEAFPSHLADDLPNDTENTYASSLIGEVIGKYKILELIGHGGMGSVFLAERDDDAYDKQVALKILRRGMDTPSNIARFKRERNILAKLDHPNIARLLDGGVSDSGLPYLVMEYVDGTPLLKYCNKNTLTLEQRLTLFKSVCRAVQHAHRNATIHRDLKPSNIYVKDNGTVKVLDFGIAKLLESETSETNLFETDTGTRILTLGYAAPEQVENKAITTATDSYTLGIVLFELLAGCHPFDLEKKDLSKIEKLIRSQTPPRPSKKFEELSLDKKNEIASQRNINSAELTESLVGDLDAIVLKALRKEPGARYPSVEQMLEDINRYEKSRPLIAQRDTIKYRAGKFVRRHRKGIISAFLILSAIIGFGSYHIDRIAKQREIAQTEAEKAQTVKNFLVDIFRSSNPRSADFEGKNITAQQLLVNGKNRVGDELENQPDAYTEIFIAIGDALKGIDAFNEAEKSYKKALTKSSQTTEPLENKIKTCVKLGWLYSDSRKSHKKAYQYAVDARELMQKVENPSPALKASVFGLLGRTLSVNGDRKQGNSYFEKADSIYVNAGLTNSYDYIKMLTGYGRALLYVFDFKKSEEVLLKSNRLYRQKFDKPSLTIAENYKYIAWTNRELGNFDKSNNYFLKSIDLKSELTGDQTFKTALSMYHLARNYTLSGEYEKSEQLAQKVLDIYQENLSPTNQYVHQAKIYTAIAKYNLGKLAEAEKMIKNVFKENDSQQYLASVKSHLAVVYQKSGRYQEAVSLLKESIKFNEKDQGQQSRAVGVDMLKLANTYRAKGDYKMARKYFLQVQSIFEEEIPDNHYREAELYFKYAKLKQETDKLQVARKYFEKAYNICVDIFGEDSNRTKRAKSYLDNIAQA